MPRLPLPLVVRSSAAGRREYSGQPGTPLAQLRSSELGRARAALLTAEARRDLARQTLERKQGLAQERIVPQREVQEAEATFRAADADARAAIAGLQALGVSDGGSDSDTSLFNLHSRSQVESSSAERSSAPMPIQAIPSSSSRTVAGMGVAQAFERDAVNIPVGSTAHVTLAALPDRIRRPRCTVGRQVERLAHRSRSRRAA